MTAAQDDDFVCTVWHRIRSIWRPPAYQSTPAYKAADAWLKSFQPSSEHQGYDKALAYAWKRFDQAQEASDTLDKKADNLMRNAGLVGGLLGLALNTLKVGEPQQLVPSLVAFVVALMLAAIACKPTGSATSASVHDVIDDIGAGHTSDAWVAASLHCAIVGRTCLNDWKAARIRWATVAFCLGLLLFLWPVVSPYIT